MAVYGVDKQDEVEDKLFRKEKKQVVVEGYTIVLDFVISVQKQGS